jgi:hypothetical protein
MPRKTINKVLELPRETHYVILKAGSHYETDGRDGSYSVEHIDYIAFDNKEAWETEVKSRAAKGETDFRAMVVSPASVEVSVIVTIKV